jgi:cytochrome c553
MKRVPGTVVGALLGAALSGFAAGSSGTEVPRPETPAAAPCEACHGTHGEGVPAAAVPRLAGQSAEYLAKQLHDYATGTRDHPVMRNFAKMLSEAERSQLAAYFTSLSAARVVEPAPPDPRLIARGRQLAAQGDEAERVQACDNCHGPEGAGLGRGVPYLAGQSAEYLASALNAWKQGSRKNDSGKLMRSVVERLSAADIRAVAAYFTSLE